jgi:tRNA (uracil-5-)-methyltransferase TRM9
MTPKIALKIEVFDQMAPGWYNFRHYSIFIPELEMLAKRWERGKLLNLGSGHGADFLPFKDKFELYGVDFSGAMIKLARRYAQKFGFSVDLQVADVCHLPFADNSFDWAISVATYHHLKKGNDQLSALKELRRVLKPQGEAFITVWNRCQRRFWFKKKEVAVPWKTGDQVVYRYYYLFTYRELERLVMKAGFKILESFPEKSYLLPVKYFSRNICLVVKKQ